MKNIFQRIADVMKDIEYLTKDDDVVTGTDKNGNERTYRAITEEKVTSSVRQALIKHGIVIIPVEQVHGRTDETIKYWDRSRKVDAERINRIATVDTKYRIQNVDDLSDYIIAASSGTGVDTQDKAVGKAMTYSFKYLLLRTFAIPTGEDPDKISSDLYTAKLTGEPEKDLDGKGTPEKYQPNVYAPEDWPEESKIAYAEVIARVPNPRYRDAACFKKYGKVFSKLNASEVIEVFDAIIAGT